MCHGQCDCQKRYHIMWHAVFKLVNGNIINARRACAAGVITMVSLCVCLSVTMLGATVFIRGYKVRYYRLLYDNFYDFSIQLSVKRQEIWCYVCLSRRALTLSATRRHNSSS